MNGLLRTPLRSTRHLLQRTAYHYPTAKMTNDAADPYTAKAEQYATPETKIKEVQKIIADCKTGLLVTRNKDGRLHSRAMAPASKEGLVFDFIANNNSGKFDELEFDDNANIAFYDTNTTDWVSVSGKAKISNDKNKIKECFSPATSAWFGDLKDGVHTGKWDDPRVSLIEVVPNEIRYWLKTSSSLGQAIEVAKGAITGETAAPGVLRTLDDTELALARKTANK